MVRYEKEKKDAEDGVEEEKKAVVQVKDNMLEDISSKTLFDEVYKKQEKIIQDKEKEMKQKKQEEMAMRLQEQQEKLLVEERKRSEANSKNAKYQDDFLKLQKYCNVKEISDLVDYESEYKDNKVELNDITDMI